MMVTNPSKFQVMFMGLGSDCKLCIEIDKMVIKTLVNIKLLGVIIDSKLKFDEHVKLLCLKANRNISVFSTVAKVFEKPNPKLLDNSFVIFNFRYSPLIWMFCGKTANVEINRAHKRPFCIVLGDYDTSFDELLVENEEKTNHFRNLQMLMVEIYKSLNHQNPSFLWELFARKDINYNLRHKDILAFPKALKASFGISSISFRGSILWDSTPDVIKSSNTVFSFIKNIKKPVSEVRNCNICI